VCMWMYLYVCLCGVPSMRQNTASHCNTLQHTATHCNIFVCVYAWKTLYTATHCRTLQHAATHCNTLQHTATHLYACMHGVPSCIPSSCQFRFVCLIAHVFLFDGGNKQPFGIEVKLAGVSFTSGKVVHLAAASVQERLSWIDCFRLAYVVCVYTYMGV